MMNFRAIATKPLTLLLAIGFYICVYTSVQAQVPWLEIDEATDFVQNRCQSEKFSIFVFRYPDIGDVDSVYSVYMEKLRQYTLVSLHDVRMTPIPGCSRPKAFELCGYKSLNPYMKYKPFLIFFSTSGSLWSKFQASEFYKKDSALFLTVTDKEGTRAPFYNAVNLEAFDILLDFLNSQSIRTSPPPKAPKSGIDSVALNRLILSLLDSRNKIMRGYLGVKISSLYGRLVTQGPPINDQNVVQSIISPLTGYALGLSYQKPLDFAGNFVKFNHRFEVGLQSVSFMSLAGRNSWSSSSIYSGTNLTASYLLNSDFTFFRNPNNIVTFGFGANVLGRFPYHILDSRSSEGPYSLKDGINPWDISFLFNGGIKHLFESSDCVFLEFGYNFGLMDFDKINNLAESRVPVSYKLNYFNISAGLQIPIR